MHRSSYHLPELRPLELPIVLGELVWNTVSFGPFVLALYDLIGLDRVGLFYTFDRFALDRFAPLHYCVAFGATKRTLGRNHVSLVLLLEAARPPKNVVWVANVVRVDVRPVREAYSGPRRTN